MAGRAKDVWHGVVEGFQEHDLLSYASAIAFQVLWALVPLALFALALAGVLGFDTASIHIREELHGTLSPAASDALDEAASAVSKGEWLWLTGGLALTLWEISGAVRTIMNVLDRVYGGPERRPFLERLRVSLPLAVAAATCLLGAVFVVRVLPGIVPVNGTLGALWVIGRWGVAGLLLLAAVWLLIHFAPAVHQPARWVSFGSALCVVAWVLMSLGFGAYLSVVADYQSLFGGLASIFVLVSYLYFSALVFLGGVQIDATLRKVASPQPAPAQAPPSPTPAS